MNAPTRKQEIERRIRLGSPAELVAILEAMSDEEYQAEYEARQNPIQQDREQA